MKKKYETSIPGKQTAKANKSARQIKLITKIMPALKSSENVINVPTIT
jgi:hypothetical protein